MLLVVSLITGAASGASSPAGRSFSIEKPPAATPPALVVAPLANDDRVRACRKQGVRTPLRQMVGAAAVRLGPVYVDQILVARHPCLLGANIGPMWVMVNFGEGYTLGARIDTHNLRVGSKKRLGYHDLIAERATAATVITQRYGFNRNSRYAPVKR